MRFTVLFMLAMLVSAPAQATDSSGNYAVWGTGKKSCFGFQKDMSEGVKDKYKHYMKGFFTAYNIFTDNTYNITSNMNENQIFEWLGSYCAENPMSTFESALTSYTFELYEDRMKSARSGGGTAW